MAKKTFIRAYANTLQDIIIQILGKSDPSLEPMWLLFTVTNKNAYDDICRAEVFGKWEFLFEMERRVECTGHSKLIHDGQSIRIVQINMGRRSANSTGTFQVGIYEFPQHREEETAKFNTDIPRYVPVPNQPIYATLPNFQMVYVHLPLQMQCNCICHPFAFAFARYG